MRYNRFTLFISLILSFIVSAHAQDTDKIRLTPTGRLLMDAETYFTSAPGFKAGAAIPEARLGLVGNYREWTGRVEVGVAYGKLVLKDIYLQADFGKKWYLRAGNYLQPFGLQSAYNASMKTTMKQPESNAVFDLPRSIGVMAHYDDRDWMGALSLIVESKASVLTSTELGHTGWGITGRGVWRPLHQPGKIVQVGWSGYWSAAQYNAVDSLNHNSIVLSGYYRTSVARVQALGATVDDARSYFKFTPELLIARGRLALESQFYYGTVWRKNSLPTYSAYGAYALLRGIVKGSDYSYFSPDARLNVPAPKSLELALQYNYTCLSDRNASLWGGRMSEVSATFNWYINRYVIWRLRGGYSHTWDRSGHAPVDLGTLQTRIQIIF